MIRYIEEISQLWGSEDWKEHKIRDNFQPLSLKSGAKVTLLVKIARLTPSTSSSSRTGVPLIVQRLLKATLSNFLSFPS